MSCRSRLREGVSCVKGMLKKSEPALVGAYNRLIRKRSQMSMKGGLRMVVESE